MKTVLDNTNVKFYTKCTIRLKFVVESKKKYSYTGWKSKRVTYNFSQYT